MMSVETILFNLFFFTFPILLFPFIMGERSLKRKTLLRISMLTGTGIMGLSWLFPVLPSASYTLDLRLAPVFIGFLYGGNAIGSALFGLFLLSHVFSQTSALAITLLIHIPLAVLFFTLAPKCNAWHIGQKILLTTALSLIHTLLIIGATFLFPLPSSVLFSALGLFIVQTTILILIIVLIERIKENRDRWEQRIKMEKSEALGQLTVSFSHEIRNALTTARGFIQLLSQSPSEKQEASYARMALTEIDRTQNVIKTYLGFTRPTLEVEKIIAVNDEITQAVRFTDDLAEMNRVQIRTALDTPLFIKGDPQKFRQCLLHLLQNSVEAMPNGGSLSIKNQRINHMVSIEIADTGIGMTEEEQQRLGEPFFTTKRHGTGLGMTASYSIVRAMGGTLQVKSDKHQGTVWVLSFPEPL